MGKGAEEAFAGRTGSNRHVTKGLPENFSMRRKAQKARSTVLSELDLEPLDVTSRLGNLFAMLGTKQEGRVFNSSQEEALQHAYRRGYYSGVSAVISGVFEKLSKEDLKKVESWLLSSLVSWRDNGGGTPAPDFPRLD
jgi:hypothetical protein